MKILTRKNWKKMGEKKVITIVFSICFIFAQISYPVAAEDQQVDIDNNQDVTLSGMNRLEIVEIECPDVVIKCFSEITVNVTVKNNRAILPYFVTVFVFLKTEDTELKNNIFVIGRKTLRIRPNTEEKVSITCRTWAHRFIYFSSKYRDHRDEVFYDGYIGARAVRGPICNSIPTRRPIVNSYFRLTDILGEKISTFSPTISDTINSMNIKFSDRNVVWKPVTLVDPFITKEIIKIEQMDIPEQTNEDGTFVVKLNISNNFSIDLPLQVVVFVRQETLFGAIFRRYLSALSAYPVGFLDDYVDIPKYSSINLTLNCSFPHENFIEGYYNVRILLYSYVTTKDNINHLGGSKYLSETIFLPSTIVEEYLSNYKLWKDYGKFFNNVPIVHYPAYIGGYLFGTKTYNIYKLREIHYSTYSQAERQAEKIVNKSLIQFEDLLNNTEQKVENLINHTKQQADDILNTAAKEANSFRNYFFIQLLAVLLTVAMFGLITYWMIRKKTY